MRSTKALRMLAALGLLAILGAIPVYSHAQDDDEPSPTAQLSELRGQLGDKISALAKKYRSSDEEERESLVQQRREFELEIVNKALKVIDSRKNASRNIRDLSWYFEKCKGKAQQKIGDKLVEAYANDSSLTRVLKRLPSPSKQVESWLRTVGKKSENEKIQATAAISLAEYLESVAELDEDYQSDRSPEEIQNEIDELLAKCIDQYSDVKDVVKRAKQKLTTANLRVGRVAPDIVGLDLDGEEFKLSDYRGKVVMVDFWGDW